MQLSTADLPFFFDSAHHDLAAELTQIAPRFAHVDDSPEGPAQIAKAMGAELGLYKHLIPDTPFNEGGKPAVRSLCLIRECLGYASPTADSIFAVQGLGHYGVWVAGSDAQQSENLPRAVAGDRIGAFALTEPEAGSDVGSMQTRALACDGGYRLTGEKVFISNVGIAHHYLVFANADPAQGKRGVCAFLVPADAPGIRSSPIAMSVHHPIGRLVFEDCFVPASAMVGPMGKGLRLAYQTLDTFRVSVGAAAIGMARRAIDASIQRLKSRVQFGEPLAQQPVLQAKLAEMLTDFDAARMLVYRAAWAKDTQPGRHSQEVAKAKLFATEKAQQIIDQAVQIHGGLGVTHAAIVEKLYREIRPLRIYEGTSEIQRLIIGSGALADLGQHKPRHLVPSIPLSPIGRSFMLFEPLPLRSALAPNRIVLPAMVTRLSGEDGMVNDAIVDRYRRYALGQPGLIVVEAMAIHESKSGPLLRASHERYLPGLSRLAEACHRESPSLVFPQIIHFLKIARSGWRQTIDMLSLEDIEQITADFAKAAQRVKDAGFDGVELHMAHAYTLSSFLSRRNRRKDRYGGTLENRLRLPCEVLARVRAQVGETFPIGVRIVGEECIKDGYTPAEAAFIAERLSRAGVDYVSLSAGGKFEDAVYRPGQPLYPYTGYSGDRCMPGTNYPDGANVYMAETVRGHLKSKDLATPVVTTGKISELSHAQRILAEGKADMVGMARALLADPDIPKKWRSGRSENVVRCIYGNVCKNLDENFKQVICTLWPKGTLNAPISQDEEGPTTSAEELNLSAEALGQKGLIRLKWQGAQDNEGIYGYEIFRGPAHDSLRHHTSVRGKTLRWDDKLALAGQAYHYAIRPYDFAGNRGSFSHTASATLDM